jgi:glutamate dehydrogenase
VRWFLTSRPATLDIAAEVARFRPGIEAYAGRIPELLQGSERARLLRRAKDLQGKGVPEELALRAASLLDGYSLLDIIEIAEETGEKLDDVVSVYFATSETFSIDAMLGRVTMLPRDDRWDAMARGALRDDLYAVLHTLTRSVLEVSNRSNAPAERLAEWSELNADALSRARGALGGIERMTHAGIAALSVALRTLRTVTKPAASSPPAAPVAQESASEPDASRPPTHATPAKPAKAAARSAATRRSTPGRKAPAKSAAVTKPAAATKTAPPPTAPAAKRAAVKTSAAKKPVQKAAPARAASAATKAAPARTSAAATKPPVATASSSRKATARSTAGASSTTSRSATKTATKTATKKTAAKRSGAARG